MSPYYHLSRAAIGQPPIVLKIEEQPPPCMRCGEPVIASSMDGPLICAACDCGVKPNGQKWTFEDYREAMEHQSQYIEKYRVENEDALG